MRTVHVKTCDPRDRYRNTMRLLPLDRFPGIPMPGELVDMVLPHALSPIPGVIHYIHFGDGIVGVEPDYQTILSRRPTYLSPASQPDPP